MDAAATNGDLELVTWLHTNRIEDCSQRALEGAAINNHLDVVKRLHAKYWKKPTNVVAQMVRVAVANGHVEIVKWLHENNFDEFGTRCMDEVAMNNHGMVQWLQENRFECLTARTMKNVRSIKLPVCKFPSGCSKRARAISTHSLWLATTPKATRRERCSTIRDYPEVVVDESG